MAFSSTVWDYLKVRSATDIYPFFYMVVEGCPYIFTTPGVSSLPADMIPDGFSTATVKELLKVGHGLAPIIERASRKAGVADTSEIDIALGPDDEHDFLLDLFAHKPATINESRLTDTFDWNDTTCYIDDVTDWPSSGTFIIGKEAVTYSGKDAPTNTLTGCTRAAFGTVANTYSPDDGYYKSPVIVRDRIVTYEGKVAHLYLGLLSSEGDVLETVQPQEIFAGPIASNPTSGDWVVWSFRVRDLTALLDTELGGFKIQGKMVNPSQYSLLPEELKKEFKYAWIEANVNDRIHVHLTGEVQTTDGYREIDEDIDFRINPGFYWNLPFAVQESINLELASLSVSDMTFDCQVYKSTSQSMDPDETFDEGFKWQIDFRFNADNGYDKTAGAQWVRVELDVEAPDSVFPMLGYQSADGIGYSSYGGWASLLFYHHYAETTATLYPILYKYDKHSLTLPVFIKNEQYAQVENAVPASGILSVGETEVVKYSSYVTDSVTVPFDNCYLFTLEEHCAFGSPEFEYVLRWDWENGGFALNQEGTDGDAIVKVMWGTDGDTVFDLLLKLMISTGGNRYPAGTYSEWDTDELPEYFSTPLPGPYIDTDSFGHWDSTFSTTALTRALAYCEPKNLKEIIHQQLVLLGLCLVPRPLPDGTYKLAVVNTQNLINQTMLDLIPLGSGDYSINTGTAANSVDVVGDEPGLRPRVEHTLNNIINRAIVKPLYSVAQEKQLDWTWIHTEEDSRLEYGVLRSVRFEAQGLGTTPSVGEDVCGELVAPLIARFSRRIPLWTFYTTRDGWRFSPGDQIAVTIPGIPNGAGGRGITDQVMTILAVEKSYFDPSRQYPCKVTAQSVIIGNHSRYAPTAKITAKGTDAGGNYITLAANEYTTAGQSPNPFGIDPDDYADILYFLGSDEITLWRLGEYSDAVSLTVDSFDIPNNKIYIDGAISPTVSDGLARITFTDWDDSDITAVQQQFAYIGALADAGGDPSEPFGWL